MIDCDIGIMYPSRNTMDYKSEINKLFTRPNEYEVRTQTPPFRGMPSPYNYPAMTNRSSSSADSMSPESFPEIPPQAPYMPEMYARQIFDTPRPTDLGTRRQRPIVGRKILGSTDPHRTDSQIPGKITKLPEEYGYSTRGWPDDVMFPPTPPLTRNLERNYPQNYELFPAENKGFDLLSPVKTSNTIQTTTNNFMGSARVSPSLPASPMRLSPQLFTHIPNSPKKQVSNFGVKVPIPSYNPNMRPPNYSRLSNYAQEGQKVCTFCKKNGETPMVYMAHSVKEIVGNKQIVTCPILRSHVCSTCGESGDNAHTITYCPILRSGNNGQPLRSTTITLKNTRVKSDGRRRY